PARDRRSARHRATVQPDLPSRPRPGALPAPLPGPSQHSANAGSTGGPTGRVPARLRVETARLLPVVLWGGAGRPPTGGRLAVDRRCPQLGPPERLRGDPLRVPQPASVH